MLWFFLSLASALCLSTTDALSKKALQSNDEYIVMWVRVGYALPFLFLFLPFIRFQQLDKTFWITTVLCIPLEIIALILYMKAIKTSPLSLTIPFLAFTPVFLIAISYTVLGEEVDNSGLLGIGLVTAGAYCLNIQEWQSGWLRSLKELKNEKGSLFMIAVAFIYSITSTLGKMAVIHSSPVEFAVIYTFFLAIGLLILMRIHTVKNFLLKKERGGSFLKAIFSASRNCLLWLIGFFYALTLGFQFKAYSLTQVSYVISVKRLSLLISIVYGWIFFNERNIRERLLGGILMLAGVILIAIF